MNTRRPDLERRPDDRSLELAAAYALGVFDEQEERELRALFGEDPAGIVREFEIAAAALDTALPAPGLVGPMPAGVRSRLAARGAEWTRASAAGRLPRASGGSSGAAAARETLPFVRTDWFAWGGWVAAAACLALALAGIWVSRSGMPAGGPSDAGQSFAVEPGATQQRIAEARSRLLYWGAAERGDALYASWTPLESPDPTARDAGGDVVWSNQHQAGYMRLEGLAPNDPGQFQYQLWIFDEDQKHPIDGGVFDVAPGQAVLVPIVAKIRVSKPTLFAVTVEKPGGVVVSDRERIALIAPEPKPVFECLPEGSVPAPRGRRSPS